MPKNKMRLILASQSTARRSMLQNTGLAFDIIPAAIDEKNIIDELEEKNTAPTQMALILSKRKALAIAARHPEALVIGSDQILEMDGRIISKAANENEAKEKLRSMRGRSHRLISAVSLAQGENILWQHSEEAVLTMRDFDEEFLESYCKKASGALLRSVGAYELEGAGAWLFSQIRGDYFTILGLPLLPLLSYLHDHHGFGP